MVSGMGGGAERRRLVCLLPVRNGARQLPAWFRSVERCCDAVVLLDDGSTDRTAAMARRHPLVKDVLTNPRRRSSAGWDDGANRQRLLDAAAALDPDWILSLDVDELLDPEDADALRQLVDVDAIPGFVYGLQHYRMWGRDRYDPEFRHIWRLFSYEPGQHLPAEQLHFDPVPVEMHGDRRLPTTVRVRHYGASTPGAVRRRLRKYAEADPGGRYPVDFGGLADVPHVGLPGWRRRPEGLPALVAGKGTAGVGPDDLDAPTMSVIVIARDDRDVITSRLRAVLAQRCDEPFEVIAVVSGSPETAALVRKELPEVELVELDEPALPGGARNAGLAVARGEFVTLPGSHVELAPGCVQARLSAHLRGFPLVAHATRNGTPTPAGWASYLLDHSDVLPGRDSARLAGPPGSCSYELSALKVADGFPEDLRAGEDTVVNIELVRRGYPAWFEPSAVQVHHSPCTSVWRLACHHFVRGRGLAQVAVRDGRIGVRRASSESRAVARARQIGRHVEWWGDDELRLRLRRVRPLVLLGALAYRTGMFVELATPRSMRALRGLRGVTLAVTGLDRRRRWRDDPGRTDVVLLVRVRSRDRSLTMLSVPRDLVLELPGHGLRRLNEAYTLGGSALLRTALQEVVGVEVDGVVAVDFEGFRKVVDRLGGLPVDVARPIDDPLGDEGENLSQARFRAGRQRLSGSQALAYARTRRADGDTARRHRHLDLLRAALGEMATASARRCSRSRSSPRKRSTTVAGCRPATPTP